MRFPEKGFASVFERRKNHRYAQIHENLDSLKGVKKLHGHFFAYRIRIGDYRLGFFKENETIILVRFLKRADIYKLFPKGY